MSYCWDASPYLSSAVPYKGFLLSEVYLGANDRRSCITAVQAVAQGSSMLGFVAADFYLRDLPQLERRAASLEREDELRRGAHHRTSPAAADFGPTPGPSPAAAVHGAVGVQVLDEDLEFRVEPRDPDALHSRGRGARPRHSGQGRQEVKQFEHNPNRGTQPI